MPILYGGEAEHASAYVCPMHPEVTDTEASSCPKCGMKLVPDRVGADLLRLPDAPGGHRHPSRPTCPKCGMKLIPADAGPWRRRGRRRAHGHEAHEHAHDHADGLEWEDLMPEINRQTNTSNMIWQLVDQRDRGRERRHHLGLPRWRPDQDPPRQRDGPGASDAPPVPHPRRGPLLGAES